MFIFLFFSFVGATEKDESNLNLTAEEREWLLNHPFIRVANELDWPPFDFNESGTPKGLAIDHIKLLAKKIGLKIDFVYGYSWAELVEQFQQKKIDVMPVFYRNNEREEFTLFTKPFYKGKLGIFTRKDDKTWNINFENKKIGMEKAHGSLPIVRKQFPGAAITEVSFKDDLVKKLATKELDAIIGNPFVFYFLAKENQISNIQLSDFVPMSTEDQSKTSLHIGIRKDWPIMHQIFQKALQNISAEEMREIEKNWTDITIVQRLNWKFVLQISFAVIVIIILLGWHNRKLKYIVEDKTQELRKLNRELESKVKQRTEELTEINIKLSKQIAKRKREGDRYKKIIEISMDGFLILDNKSKILNANDAYCSMIGYSKEELTGMSVMDIEAMMSLDEVDKKIQEIMQSSRGRFETQHRHKNGKIIDVEISITYTAESGGLFFVFVRDISERRAAEKLLQEKDHFQEQLLNDMLTFVAVLAPNGDIIFVNNTPLKVGGLTLEEIVGKKFYDASWWTHSDEVRNTVMQDIEECATGKTLAHDVQIRIADGSLMWIEFSMHPIFDGEGKIQYLIPEGRDITERKQAEEEVANYSERQTVLLREVNHRVKNNLTSIISLLHKEEDRAEDEGLIDYLPRLQETVGRIEGLLIVHSILSKGGWNPLPLQHLCEMIISHVFQGSSIDQEASYTVSDSDIIVDSDQAHSLTMVLNELTTNAVKYRSPDKPPHIEVSINSQEDHIHLTFCDNGPGYPENILKGVIPKKSLGIGLMFGIVSKSLQGKVELLNDNGAVARIVFSKPKIGLAS